MVDSGDTIMINHQGYKGRASTGYETQSNRSSDGDSATHHQRSDRLFRQKGMWFFKTREGKDVGPFRYRDEAELMLTRFVQEVAEKEREMLARAKPHFRTWAGIGGHRGS